MPSPAHMPMGRAAAASRSGVHATATCRPTAVGLPRRFQAAAGVRLQAYDCVPQGRLWQRLREAGMGAA